MRSCSDLLLVPLCYGPNPEDVLLLTPAVKVLELISQTSMKKIFLLKLFYSCNFDTRSKLVKILKIKHHVCTRSSLRIRSRASGSLLRERIQET